MAALIAIGPYVLAEGLTGFGNSRAILSHLASVGERPVPVEVSTTMALVISVDPMRLLQGVGLGPVPVIVVGLALSSIALWLGAQSRHFPTDVPADRSESVLFWLTVCGVASIAGQALFLWWMARPFEGYHHLTLLTPFYAVVPAALLRRAALRQPRSAPSPLLLGCIVLAVLVLAAPSLADQYVERTPWS